MILLITWTIGTVIYIPLNLGLTFDEEYRALITNIWACISCYAYCYIATYLVIRQYNKQIRDNGHGNKKEMTLQEILLSKDAFMLFATHLVNEFSVENLAFMFEVMQIKSEAINHRFF